MKEKILLLMPSFMGYNESIISSLESKYDVYYLNNQENIELIENKISNSIILRVIRKVSKLINCDMVVYQLIFTHHFNKVNQAILTPKYDYIIDINGHYLSNSFYKKLKMNNSNGKFILYFWDDLASIKSYSHYKYFDKVYSFNLDDCKKLRAKYLQMFTQDVEIGHDYNEYDICVIGTAHNERVEIVKRIYEMYKNDYKFYIYFYHPNYVSDFFWHLKPLSFSEYMEVLRKSRVVLDLPFELQKGPTTRSFDALVSKTKVVTTNSDIVKYPVYSSNIYILNKNNPYIPKDFVFGDYEEVDRTILFVDDWTNKLLQK